MALGLQRECFLYKAFKKRREERRLSEQQLAEENRRAWREKMGERVRKFYNEATDRFDDVATAASDLYSSGRLNNKTQNALDKIGSYADFYYYYIRNICFREKVNRLYAEWLKEKHANRQKEGYTKDYIQKMVDGVELTDVRLHAPVSVYRNKLPEAKILLEGCLAQRASSNQPVSYNVSWVDTPDSPIISPFDRRLDRLIVDNEGEYGIIPISTAYAQSATIGYTVSAAYLRESGVENIQNYIDKMNKDVAEMQNDDYYVGVPALMNNYAYIKLYGSRGGYHLINQKNQRKWYEVDQVIGDDTIVNISQNPTTSSIISWGNADPYSRTPYNFTDFVFCKHWNKVPNNRLITLRRYPAPIVDNLKFPGMDGTYAEGTPDIGGEEPGGSSKKIHFPPMATAVTYFGEETGNSLGDILKFTTGFEWEDVESDVWNVTASETPSADTGPGGLWSGLTRLAKTLNVAIGNWNNEAVLNQGQLPPDPYVDGPYENRIIGPVNRITKVKKRAPGIKFEMSGIELKFEYVARPIGGVNTKAVLLDILSNFFVLGSTSAMFFGGQHRFMHAPQKYPFIGGQKGIQQWYSGKPLEWGSTTVASVLDQSMSVGSAFLEAAKNFFNSLLGKPGDGNKDIFGTLRDQYQGSAAGDMTKNIIKRYAAEKSSGQIPYLQGLKALLTGEPVGEWHVTIGNPLNPIAMIGNLVCDTVEVEFSDELGPDDFPLELKVTVRLDHGMARDRDALQSIFNRGMGRIYDLPDSFRGSAEGETKIDDKTGNAPLTGRDPIYYRVPFALGGGGGFAPARVVENAMRGNVSVWNRNRFTAVSPNSDQILRTKDNPLFRSQYRAMDWVALKSLR